MSGKIFAWKQSPQYQCIKLFYEKTDWQRGLITNVIHCMLSTRALPCIQRQIVWKQKDGQWYSMQIILKW